MLISDPGFLLSFLNYCEVSMKHNRFHLFYQVCTCIGSFFWPRTQSYLPGTLVFPTSPISTLT